MAELVLYAPHFDSVKLIECSPPSWMVQLALEEKGLPHRVRWLSFSNGEHKTPEMLERNARGTIPVLSHGDTHLNETLGMLEYLELVFPEPALLPTQPVQRGLALHRLHASGHLKDRGMALFAYLMRTEAAERDAERVTELRQGFDDEILVWERDVADRSDAPLELADLTLFTYLATAARLGLKLDRFPALESLVRRVAQRPAVQRAWPVSWSRQALEGEQNTLA